MLQAAFPAFAHQRTKHFNDKYHALRVPGRQAGAKVIKFVAMHAAVLYMKYAGLRTIAIMSGIPGTTHGMFYVGLGNNEPTSGRGHRSHH